MAGVIKIIVRRITQHASAESRTNSHEISFTRKHSSLSSAPGRLSQVDLPLDGVRHDRF